MPKVSVDLARKVTQSALSALPIIDVPFERIARDVVSHLECCKACNKYILVICDYAMHYAETFPLWHVKTIQVATVSVQLFLRLGIREVITDQETHFRSKLLCQVYQLMGIKGIKTTPYHPQTDRLVKHFSCTLKSMLGKFIVMTGSHNEKSHRLPLGFPLLNSCMAGKYEIP